jgi:molybdopterin-guanine dinucleotide biosynthesis protein A
MQAAGFVLAGGQSSRMGTNKALLMLDGETLVERALSKLRRVCSEVAIAGGVAELARFGRVLPDAVRERGPLSGIMAALEQTACDWNVILAVDVPFLPVEALHRLLAERDEESICVMAETEGLKHPLCAVYHRQALAALQAEFARGNGRVTTAIAAAGQVKYVRFAEVAWFRNLNTPEEFAHAQGRDERPL